MQLKRSERSRSGTRNGPQDKEHNATTESHSAPFNSKRRTRRNDDRAKKGKERFTAVEACPAALASKINPDKNHNPKPKRARIRSRESVSLWRVSCEDYGVCLESNTRTSSTPAQHARRSSPAQQPGARPEAFTKNKEEKMQMSCVCRGVAPSRNCHDAADRVAKAAGDGYGLRSVPST